MVKALDITIVHDEIALLHAQLIPVSKKLIPFSVTISAKALKLIGLKSS